MKHCKFKKSNVHSRGCFSWSNLSRKIMSESLRVNKKMKHIRIRHKKSNASFSWSNLPGKIIFKISKKLETKDDILRFKQVCLKWCKRSLTPPTNLLSLNIPLPQTIKNNTKAFPFHNSKSPLVLRVSNIYLITPSQDNANDQSLKPWMVMAEELNPGKIKVRHPLTAKRVKNFPPFLDMNRFKALTLAQGYNFKSSNCVHKVLLCSNSASSVQVLVLYYKGVLGKLSLDVLESRYVNSDDDDDDNDDDDEEEELFYSWENFRVRQGGTFYFIYLDDVTRFKDKNYGVDRKGRLYVLDTESMSMSNSSVLLSKSIYRGDMPSNRRKRLVVDSISGELHLVVRERLQVTRKVRFKVYKLNEQEKCWDVVETIGHEKVLFVGIDHCFFAMARHFPGCDGNSIVFASHCFTQYNGFDAPDNSLFDDEETEVGMYRLGEGDNFQLLSLACPEFAGIFWPPPAWFCTRYDYEINLLMLLYMLNLRSPEVGNSSFECLSDDNVEGLLSESSSGETECTSKDSDNDVEMLSDSPDTDEEMESECSGDIDCKDSDARFSDQIGKEHSDAQEQTSEKQSDVQEQATVEHSGAQEQPVKDAQEQTLEKQSDAQKQTKVEHSDAQEQPVNDHFALPVLGSEEHEFMEEKVCDANRMSATPLFSSDPGKSSTVKFQGVDIRSDLLPTLQTIWAKHGNLFTKDTIHNKKMLGCAMEELAELIITLKNTTARTLTDCKVGEMKSTLSDIKRAGLKVEWLEPVIKNAIAVQKSKPFIESIAAVDRKKAKIEEEEREFLARTAKDKQELDEDQACLSTRIPFPADQIIDLDDNLGHGL